MQRFPLSAGSGLTFDISAGVQDGLVKDIINEFCSRFTPGGIPIYVTDNNKKRTWFDTGYLQSLGVVVEEHGRMPNVVVHFTKMDRIFLIEAVPSHAPVNPKRLTELRSMFAGIKARLVFVTAFLDRRGASNYLGGIAWGTAVWLADAPDHLIHFNGERLAGPY